MPAITLKLATAHFLLTSYFLIFSLSDTYHIREGVNSPFSSFNRVVTTAPLIVLRVTDLFYHQTLDTGFGLLLLWHKTSSPCLLLLWCQTCWENRNCACCTKGECCCMWETIALLLKWQIFEYAKVIGKRKRKLAWTYLDIFWEINYLWIFEEKSKIFVDSEVAIRLATSKLTSPVT
jgi:hypothetical protein